MGANHGKVKRTQSAPKVLLTSSERPRGKPKFSLPTEERQHMEVERRFSQMLTVRRTSDEKQLATSSDSLHLSPSKFPSGSKLSKRSRHTSSRTTSIKLLSLRSRELIKDSWVVVQEWSAMTGHSAGILIFDRIFKECPQLRPVFHLKDDEIIDAIDESHPFLRHANVFTNMIDLTVRNIDELEMQIAPALITYGRRHFYKHHVGFNPMYMNVFADSIVLTVEYILGEQCDEETSDAWHQLTQYMVHKLKHGYDFEGLNRKKSAFFT
uniref:Globin family profile domain-containing protein n=1 Tax=Plectus sambesii TaxID=2011161 RepID=A0A914V8I6_9BILA